MPLIPALGKQEDLWEFEDSQGYSEKPKIKIKLGLVSPVVERSERSSTHVTVGMEC